jgi:hypothetical protein
MTQLENVTMYNYADDNTISCHGKHIDDVIENVERATGAALH